MTVDLLWKVMQQRLAHGHAVCFVSQCQNPVGVLQHNTHGHSYISLASALFRCSEFAQGLAQSPSQLCVLLFCSTRAFLFAKKPTMTPAEALSILAKLEGAAKAEESEASYV